MRATHRPFTGECGEIRAFEDATAQSGPATGPFHWKNGRLLARELCRLQTIPDDYMAGGSLINRSDGCLRLFVLCSQSLLLCVNEGEENLRRRSLHGNE
jgi:hypothetical protein